MAGYDLGPEVVTRVREATDMLEVVGDHVRLKRRGRRWEGLCPFHDEKTPSFSVDPDKGLYHCFGCHAGGDVISFLMRLEHLEFPDAVELLARRYGVQLPEKSAGEHARQRDADRQRTLLEEAQRWFAERLAASDGAAARAELERRGFPPATWADFGFGYAPDAWRELLDHLGRRHPEGSVVAAGLAVLPEDRHRPYDRFRHRLTFPIRRVDGQLVAFGGRILGAGEPKYLNSPESPLFSKRATLFCLDRARRAIADAGEAVVVEGYFDCLSLHRVGVTRVVATLGTALTADHARILRRLVGEDGRVVVCYDGDAAGRRAAASGAQVLLEASLNLAVAVLPAGVDPDDVIRAQGVAGLEHLLAQPTPLLEFLLQDLPADPAERRRAGLALAPLVCAAANPATRQNLIEELARQLYLRPREIEEHGRHLPRAGGAAPPRVVASSPVGPGERTLTRILLECSPAWRQRILAVVEVELVVDARVRAVIAAIAAAAATSSGNLDAVALLATLDDAAGRLVRELLHGQLPDLDDDAVERQLATVLDHQRRLQAQRLGPLIAAAERRGDLAEVDRLLADKAKLRQNPTKF